MMICPAGTSIQPGSLVSRSELTITAGACTSRYLFSPQPGCGKTGEKYQCMGLSILSCSQDNSSHSMQMQNCH